MGIENLLDNATITINCPACNCPIDIKLIQVRLEETIICPACNKEIGLKDVDGSTSNASKNIQDSIRSLTDELKHVN